MSFALDSHNPASKRSFLQKRAMFEQKAVKEPLSDTLSDTVRESRGLEPLSVRTNTDLENSLDSICPIEPVESHPLLAIEESDTSDNPQTKDSSLEDLTAELTEGPDTIEKEDLLDNNPANLESADVVEEQPFSESFQTSSSANRLDCFNTGNPNQNIEPIQQAAAVASHTVTADFPILLNCPPPNVLQHPINQVDPFTSTSDAPELVTTSTPERVLAWAGRMRDYSPIEAGKENRFIDDRSNVRTPKSSGKKKKVFSSEKKTRDSLQISVWQAIRDNSPTETKKRSGWMAPGGLLAPIETGWTRRERKPSSKRAGEQKKTINAMRSFSNLPNLFKMKANSDNTMGAGSAMSPELLIKSPLLGRKDLEHYLRIVTNCHSQDYDPANMFPRHPTTGKDWRSRNLKCTNCTELCACCGRTCCAYKGAVLALERNKDDESLTEQAIYKIQEITKVFPYGKEVPTFFQCTHGGGCGKLICPDCCGICPNESCGDTQCRRCKKDPWAECDWHLGSNNGERTDANNCKAKDTV